MSFKDVGISKPHYTPLTFPKGSTPPKPSQTKIGQQNLKQQGIEKLAKDFQITETKVSSLPHQRILENFDQVEKGLMDIHSNFMGAFDIIEKETEPKVDIKTGVEHQIEETVHEDDLVEITNSKTEGSYENFETETIYGEEETLVEINDNYEPVDSEAKTEFESTKQILTQDQPSKVEVNSKTSLKEIRVASTNVEKTNAPKDEGAKTLKEKVGGLKGVLKFISNLLKAIKAKNSFKRGDVDFNATNPFFKTKEKAAAEWKDPPEILDKGKNFRVDKNMSPQEKAQILDNRDKAMGDRISLSLPFTNKNYSQQMISDNPAAISVKLGHGLQEIYEKVKEGGDKNTLMDEVANLYVENASSYTIEKFPVERLADFAIQLRSEGRTDKADLLEKIVNNIQNKRSSETVYNDNITNATNVVRLHTDEGTFLRQTSDDGPAAVKKITMLYTADLQKEMMKDLRKLGGNYGFRALDSLTANEKVTSAKVEMSKELASHIIAGSEKLLDVLTARQLPDNEVKFLEKLTQDINGRTDLGQEEKTRFVRRLYTDQVFLKVLVPLVTDSTKQSAPQSLKLCSAVLQRIANGAADGNLSDTLTDALDNRYGEIVGKMNDFLVRCGMPETSKI